jgi:L-alanine-DL-glutamate epimerase-like enolase superfamily enzyme
MALDAQAVLRKERADRERRLEALAVAVLTALGERDALVRDAERRCASAADLDAEVLDYLADTAPLDFVDGYVQRFTGPGLGLDIDEAAVREADRKGHAWRNPVWRHADGSLAEW